MRRGIAIRKSHRNRNYRSREFQECALSIGYEQTLGAKWREKFKRGRCAWGTSHVAQGDNQARCRAVCEVR